MARPRLDSPNFKLARRGDRFYVRWWEAGQWKRISTGTEDRREAARFLAQFAAGHGTPEPPALPTIDEILAGYLADRKDRVAAYATLEACAKSLRRHLGELQPDHLTTERSKFYAKRRRAEGYMVGPPQARRKKPVSDGTILRELLTLRAALKWAVEEKWIKDRPKIVVPRQPAPRDRWLTREEANRLIATSTGHVHLFIALALYTGARAGALLELTWDRVDLVNERIDLGRGTGNKRRARLPISAPLLPILREARSWAISPFVVSVGAKPVASIKTGFRAACRRAGLAGVTPHSLRHTAATWMVQGGRSFEEVAMFLGNRAEVIERVYGHHSPDFLKAAAAALAGPQKST